MNDDTSLRPMMNISDMIPYLKNKNIKFNIINEAEAENYLRENNNYYNLTSYKNNFEKYFMNGKFIDKYIDLDFSYLIDLAIIDYKLRLILFNMIIDIEHYLKIRILNIIENINEEDGYRIVNMFLDNDYNNEKFPKKIHKSIFKKVDSEYYQKIFSKYDIDEDNKLENIPVWEFLEIITFGELVNFYEFFSKEYNLQNELKYVYILREIVKLRNAVAHNSCILCELDKKDIKYSPDYKVVKFLNSCGIKSKARNNKLSNYRIRQITYTLYLYNIIVTSNGVKEKTTDSLNSLVYERIILHKEYYNSNELLKSVYLYFSKIISKKYKKLSQNSLT